MRHTTRLILLIALCTFALVQMAKAKQIRYALDPERSVVEFTYARNGVAQTGTMPVTSADLLIDFARVARSEAAVKLDVSGTKTGDFFATQALKGASVLDTQNHPEAHFQSTSVTGSLREGAQITGDVTLRGVTRPLTLAAEIYRLPDTAEDDLDTLQVILTGSLMRSDFGATGFPEMVADEITLRIIAFITAQ